MKNELLPFEEQLTIKKELKQTKDELHKTQELNKALLQELCRNYVQLEDSKLSESKLNIKQEARSIELYSLLKDRTDRKFNNIMTKLTDSYATDKDSK